MPDNQGLEPDTTTSRTSSENPDKNYAQSQATHISAFVRIVETLVDAHDANQHPRLSDSIEQHPQHAVELLTFFATFQDQTQALASLAPAAASALSAPPGHHPASPPQRTGAGGAQRPIKGTLPDAPQQVTIEHAAGRHSAHDAPPGAMPVSPTNAGHLRPHRSDTPTGDAQPLAASSISRLAADRQIALEQLAASVELSHALIHWLDATALEPDSPESVPSELVTQLAQELRQSRNDMKASLRVSHHEAVTSLEQLGHAHLLQHTTFHEALGHDTTATAAHHKRWRKKST